LVLLLTRAVLLAATLWLRRIIFIVVILLVLNFVYLDRPLTYVYNTLHYYDRRLQDRAALKRKLVSVVVGMKIIKYYFNYLC